MGLEFGQMGVSASEGLGSVEGNRPRAAAAGVVFLAAESSRQGSELVGVVPVPGAFWGAWGSVSPNADATWRCWCVSRKMRLL